MSTAPLDSFIDIFCTQCGKPLRVPVNKQGMDWFFSGKNIGICCDPCYDKKNKKSSGLQEWQTLALDSIPTAMKSSDIAHLKKLSEVDVDAILAWRPSKEGPTRGYLFHGPSGRGKSRLACLLMIALITARFKTVFLNPVDLRRETDSRARTSLSSWTEMMIRVPVLILDDLGKLNAKGHRVEEELFSIVKGRCDSGRPIVVTTNETADRLRACFSGTFGDAIVQRIMDNTDRISFYLRSEIGDEQTELV